MNSSSTLVPSLANRIIEIICREDYAIGHRLTEKSLVTELGVSRTPVRQALKMLEDRGAVTSMPNVGVSVAADVRKLRTLLHPLDQAPEERAYVRIVDDHLSGALPEEVNEIELMERYELSRLEVQRVLNKLARESFVERKPGFGWKFRPQLGSVSAYEESYRFRMIIEPAALLEPHYKVDRVAFARCRKQQQQILDGGMQKWTRSELFGAGANLHETLVAGAGNTLLLDSIRNVNRLRRHLEFRLKLDRSRLAGQCQEHLQLLDMVESGSRVAAAAFLRDHLDVVKNSKTGNDSAASSATERPRRKPLKQA